MMSEKPRQLQQTIATAVSISGRGLHTGKKATVTVEPAEADTGIVFRRHLKSGQTLDVPALWQYVHDMPLCTCLAIDGVQVRTVEHLLTALYAAGIDNAVIAIQGEEVPIMDGSSKPFFDPVQAAGVTLLGQPRKRLRVLKRVEYAEGAKRVAIEPAETFDVDVTISLKKIGRLNWAGTVTQEALRSELVYARTFGRVTPLMVLGGIVGFFTRTKILLGARPSSSIFIVGDKGITKGGLRAPDEYVRHRVLDLVGDMLLVGGDLRAKVTTFSTAHRLNHRLLEKLFADPDAWCWE